ncbi:MAG: hypothetical protein K2G73_03450 [Eubacterium sp.]|nr:hypothetical protein [Eubacterium sp.]
MSKTDLPIGFGMALAQNENAMKQFESLSSSQKEAIINKTRKINSKNEMQCFVNCLSEGSLNI